MTRVAGRDRHRLRPSVYTVSDPRTRRSNRSLKACARRRQHDLFWIADRIEAVMKREKKCSRTSTGIPP